MFFFCDSTDFFCRVIWKDFVTVLWDAFVLWQLEDVFKVILIIMLRLLMFGRWHIFEAFCLCFIVLQSCLALNLQWGLMAANFVWTW